MPNRRYQAGRRFEWIVKRDLERAGWWVIRAAGSKGKADLVCLQRGYAPLLVQCKLNGKIGRDEAKEFYLLSISVGATETIASRPERGVIEYKRLNGVIWSP